MSDGRYCALADVAVSVSVIVSVVPLRSNCALADRVLPDVPFIPPPVNVMELANAVETKKLNAAVRIVLVGR